MPVDADLANWNKENFWPLQLSPGREEPQMHNSEPTLGQEDHQQPDVAPTVPAEDEQQLVEKQQEAAKRARLDHTLMVVDDDHTDENAELAQQLLELCAWWKNYDALFEQQRRSALIEEKLFSVTEERGLHVPKPQQKCMVATTPKCGAAVRVVLGELPLLCVQPTRRRLNFGGGKEEKATRV